MKAATYMGKVCKRGHNDGGGSIRYVKCRTCIRCDNLRGKERYAKYPNKAREWCRKWEAENRDRIVTYRRNWSKANRDKTYGYTRKWREANPDVYLRIVSVNATKRRAMKLRAMPAWADQKAISAVYAEAKRLSRETGVKHHVDHIVPLNHKQVSGLHVPANLQILPAADNIRKSNRFVIE